MPAPSDPVRTLEIVCAHHKPFPFSAAPFIVNVQTGRQGATVALPFHGDDEGIAISDLNPHFAELTALYWYWKNRPLADHIGLCHYRRYFDLRRPSTAARLTRGRADEMPISHRPVGEFATSGVDSKRTAARITRALGHHDVLLARPLSLDMSIEQQYTTCHPSRSWQVLFDVLEDLDRADARRAREYFRTRTRLHAWNMFVTSRDVLDRYLTWLFPILFEFHARIDYPAEAYQARLPAFAAERLLDYYVVARDGLRVAEIPVLMFEG